MTNLDPRPHVAHVIDELPPDGAERLLVDMLKHRADDFRFTVVCLIGGGALEAELEALGVPVVMVKRRGRFDPGLLLRLARWFRENRVSVVHTHLFTADSYGRVAARLAGVSAVFTTVHSTNTWKGTAHRVVDWLLSFITTRVIACTAEVGAVLRKRDRLPSRRIEVVPNGVDLGRFAGASASGVREEFHIPADRLLIGLVGRLHPAKGHEDLIEALVPLRAAGVSFTCLFAGEGELRETLTQSVRRHGLLDYVVFAGQRADVPRLLAALDVLAMPSRWEGLPITLLEAMASGLPVVATRVGGIPDVVRDGVNGVLVAPGDRDALLAALRRLATDSAERRRLGNAARDWARQHYNVAGTARAYESLYRRALGLPAVVPHPSANGAL